MSNITSDFWDEKVRWKQAGDVLPDGSKAIRYNHVHYVFEKESTAPAHTRGFDGRRFWAVMKDGTTITSNNVWHQGTIPEEYRKVLPDNAVLLSETKP